MKKGLTLIELLIAIALLGVISAATFSIFATATQNYRVQSQKSFMQKELNFVVDALANEIKEAAGVEQSYGAYTLSSETLILKMPAVDSTNNFVYTAGQQFDYIIYTKNEGTLRKVVIPDANSKRGAKNAIILTDIATFNVTYSPNLLSPISVEATTELNRPVGKRTVKISGKSSGFMRNQ